MAKIGVDFGTTHTSAAYYNPHTEELQFFQLDPVNTDNKLLRSMLYITREQEHLLGREAVETYLREDTGRIARYEEKMVGTIENMVAPNQSWLYRAGWSDSHYLRCHHRGRCQCQRPSHPVGQNRPTRPRIQRHQYL